MHDNNAIVATFGNEAKTRAFHVTAGGEIMEVTRETRSHMWSPPEVVAAMQSSTPEVAAVIGSTRTYDDATRLDDCEKLQHREVNGTISIIGTPGLHAALAVFLIDPKLRAMLEAADPKAVEQAREAMLLT
jgi:hypothetical protein